MSNCGSRFKAMLKRRGYNMTRLADELGLTRTQISNRVHGAVPWSLPEAVQASKALGMTLPEFAAYFPAGRKGA